MRRASTEQSACTLRQASVMKKLAWGTLAEAAVRQTATGRARLPGPASTCRDVKSQSGSGQHLCQLLKSLDSIWPLVSRPTWHPDEHLHLHHAEKPALCQFTLEDTGSKPYVNLLGKILCLKAAQCCNTHSNIFQLDQAAHPVTYAEHQ